MYNVAVVRQLCADIIAEKDSVKVEQLITLLQAVVREDQEEIRMRMAFLAKKYSDILEQSPAAD
ncbi:MAG: hypothetical protein JWQ87_1585 [Candidatus Sulfotelmatobacter sp.]|nr:hypothetical protein [Candidatus Sulfotelmatobacter sp.]